jgi:transcription elongation GreA/GreB family factor
MTPQAHNRLKDELALLNSLGAAGTADDENAVVVQRARRTRIQQIHDLLLKAVVGQDPPDDGIAEPGMVLTVRFDRTGETETFLLGVRDAEYGDVEVYTVTSPLGAALLGARPGDRREYVVPNGQVMAVTLLESVPYGLHVGDDARAG